MPRSTWTKVEATWDLARIRKEAGRLITDYKMAIWLVLQNEPEILEKLQAILYGQFVDQLKADGVKTPMDLVRYLAELTVNLVGGTASISGDDNEASIAFDHIPGWDQTKDKLELDSSEQKEKLMLVFRDSLDRFCALLDLNFTAEVEGDFECPVAKLTFRCKS